MRILCISYAFAPSVGGIESMSKTLTDEWRSMGHEVKIVTHILGDRPDEPDILRQPSRDKLWELYRWCDVCYMNNISLHYAMPFLFSRKTVLTAAGLPNDFGEPATTTTRLKRFFYARRRTIAISSYMAGALKGANTIIPNCYDDRTFTNTVPWSQRTSDIVVVARLVDGKGVHIAIQALGKLLDLGEKRNLTVVGSGQEEDALKKLAQELGVSSQVKFAGTLRGAELATEINQHKIFLVPSVYREPFGIVCLEGIACGCIVIGSDTGGIPDAIGHCGVLFPMGDADALANAISKYCDTAENPFAAQAPGHLAKHTAAAVASAYIRVFEEQAPRTL